MIPREGVGWTWELSYHANGFAAVSVEVARQSIYKGEMPAGYTEEALGECREKSAGKEGSKTPDIIMILNESWYDLSLISDFETNEPVRPFIDSLDNVICGYAVVPGIGGGTNSSEYEFLTGNSLQLIQGISTPFGSLNMEEESTVVTVLKQQGYRTAAFHPAPGSNYSRNLAYPAMGFDRVCFEDDVEGLEYWLQRVYFATDGSDFSVLTQLYEDGRKEGEEPLFLYNLTIQNHGGYASVSPGKVSMQVTAGFEEMDEWSHFEINEYLACLNMTDQAFKGLIEYFKAVDRPVILCMVGDHCPTIAPKFINKDLTEAEEMLYLHSTPFVIWANWELEEEDWGFIGMPNLMPKLLDVADVGLSPYYRYIAEELTPEVPAVTSFGLYLDQEQDFYSYGEGGCTDLIAPYLFMEYWNLAGNKEDKLFMPPSSK